jgi:hypothetical protein
MAGRKRAPAPVKRPAGAPFEIPAPRPVASGELVNIRDIPDYRRKHGLRIVGAEWPHVRDASGCWHAVEPYPRLIVEDDPQKGKETL